MIRNTVSAPLADFERASGACSIAAKRARERGDATLEAFFHGAVAALDVFSDIENPDALHAAVMSRYNAIYGTD